MSILVELTKMEGEVFVLFANCIASVVADNVRDNLLPSSASSATNACCCCRRAAVAGLQHCTCRKWRGDIVLRVDHVLGHVEACSHARRVLHTHSLLQLFVTASDRNKHVPFAVMFSLDVLFTMISY